MGKMCAMSSRDLTNWEDISEKITFPEGVRHGTIIEVDEKYLKNLLLIQLTITGFH